LHQIEKKGNEKAENKKLQTSNKKGAVRIRGSTYESKNEANNSE
jgi:hypothetical protein